MAELQKHPAGERHSKKEDDKDDDDEEEESINHPIDNSQNEASSITSQLTLPEKLSLCSGRNLWQLQPIPRLNLPSIFITDGPHGLRKTTKGDSVLLKDRLPSTCFPTSSCLASSWDESLIKEVGVAIAKECLQQNVSVVLGPGVNIKRHPLGGRNFEYYSEDPYLSGKLASSFVKGVQSLSVGTSLKHFVANNHEFDRMTTDAIVDQRTLREIYLRGFEIVVKESKPWTVMMAYNRLNGLYCTEHTWLCRTVLREEWGFDGLTVTDWCATNDRVNGIRAGIDLEMPGSSGVHDQMIKDALSDGTLKIEDLDAVVQRNVHLILKARDTLEKEKECRQSSSSSTQSMALETKEEENAQSIVETHHALAKKVATQCAILLKNDDNLLPLSHQPKVQLAIIGEFAKNPKFQGMGSSQVLATKVDTAWEYLTSNYPSVSPVYAAGYSYKDDGTNIDDSLINEAVDAAKSSEYAIVFAGLPGPCESEGFDRVHMGIPPQQEKLIKEVCNVNPNTIVILSNGPPITMPWVDKPKSILEGYLAGQAGGSALIDLIFGVSSPCGKLAETFPMKMEDVPSDPWFPREGKNEVGRGERGCRVEYREGLNVGYRYFDTADIPVLFPFGHGLSYASFEYGPLCTSSTTISNKEQEEKLCVGVEVEIHNTSDVAAAEVVQCYVHDVESTVYRPEQELRAFSKIFLEPNERKRVQFNLGPDAFSFYDVGAKKWIVEPGEFEIRIGSSSRDIKRRTSINIERGQAPSMKARVSHPTDTNISTPLTVDDDMFAQMMGKEILTPSSSLPKAAVVGPFHRNSKLADLQHSFLGRIIRSAIIKGTMVMVDADIVDDNCIRKVAEAMVDHLPVRGLVLISQGYFTFVALDVLLALLNQQYFCFTTLLFYSLMNRLLRLIPMRNR